jgi:hypothetical protein
MMIEHGIIPQEVASAIARDAESDADAVADFLDILGLTASTRLPGRLFVGLAAGLRLLTWETEGYSVHRAMGLPPAAEVIRDVIERAADPDDDRQDFIIATLWAVVIGVKEMFFAWEAPSFFDSEVLLGELPEDDLINALASLCWANRNIGVERE